jgi:uncharacterized membrane protein
MSKNQIGLDRMVFFSDAIFAIAITLLIVNIKLPISNDHLPTVRHYLINQLPKYQSYVTTFLVIGLYWMGHHHYFRYIQRYNFTLLGLNMGFLMCIVFLPFPASILDNYDGQRLAVVFYAFSMAITGLMKALLWGYASWHHRLVAHNLHPRLIRALTYYTLVPPLVFLSSMLIAIFNPAIAQFSWLLIAVLFILPQLFRNRPAV